MDKIIFQNTNSFIEYDPQTKVISVSRGGSYHYILCAQIFNVPAENVDWDLLRSIAWRQTVGFTISSTW